MKKILALRIIETIFLFGIVFIKTITPEQWSKSTSYLAAGFHLNLSTNADTYIFSTLLIGYVVSLIASFMQRGIKNECLKPSFVFAILGVAGFSNEILRYIIEYRFQLILSFPILLLIFDWLAFFRLLKKSPNQNIEPTLKTPVESGEVESGEAHV
ncbi:MAG TPA: hypothetical protein PLD51_04665 [Pontiellaceae bacterium]|mgnify:CR=1 FL=1|nr:hypothetical protein [Pontiellaceae bacterium]HPR83133.1 hypothetical protein [Pontiellaceae bacterium]